MTFQSRGVRIRSVKTENDFQFTKNGNTHDLGELTAALIQAGYSNTHARRAVLSAIVEADGQASPAQLLELGRTHHPALGLVTVYRTLDILLALGLVRKLHLEEGCHTYALSLAGRHTGGAKHCSGEKHADAVHGHHIVCQRCHRAVEFEGCEMTAMVALAEAQTGFQVLDHWVEMFGVCPECQTEELHK